MKILEVLIILIFCINSKSHFAQDSLIVETYLNNEMQGQHNLYALTNRNIQGVNSNGLNIPDNPINHFAVYDGLTLHTKVHQKYHLETGLVMEERSFSALPQSCPNLKYKHSDYSYYSKLSNSDFIFAIFYLWLEIILLFQIVETEKI